MFRVHPPVKGFGFRVMTNMKLSWSLGIRVLEFGGVGGFGFGGLCRVEDVELWVA